MVMSVGHHLLDGLSSERQHLSIPSCLVNLRLQGRRQCTESVCPRQHMRSRSNTRFALSHGGIYWRTEMTANHYRANVTNKSFHRKTFVEGLVTVVTSYHQGYTCTGSTKIIHRYLPRNRWAIGVLNVAYPSNQSKIRYPAGWQELM